MCSFCFSSSSQMVTDRHRSINGIRVNKQVINNSFRGNAPQTHPSVTLTQPIFTEKQQRVPTETQFLICGTFTAFKLIYFCWILVFTLLLNSFPDVRLAGITTQTDIFSPLVIALIDKLSLPLNLMIFFCNNTARWNRWKTISESVWEFAHRRRTHTTLQPLQHLSQLVTLWLVIGCWSTHAVCIRKKKKTYHGFMWSVRKRSVNETALTSSQYQTIYCMHQILQR